MLAAGDFADAFKWLLAGDFVEFCKKVSILPVKFDNLESELKDCKELCRVYAKECGRLQNIIDQIPPEIVAQYEIVHLP